MSEISTHFSDRKTWFEVMEMNPEAGFGFYVLRMDRATLPSATVTGGPYQTFDAAEIVAEQMRKTGTA